MSVAARGKMRKLRDAGEAMPIGWALDAAGNPTTDPVAGLDGFIQFIGGHKGYGLSLMVEMLGGLLSGGRFLDGVTVAELPRPVEVVATDGIALRAALELT